MGSSDVKQVDTIYKFALEFFSVKRLVSCNHLIGCIFDVIFSTFEPRAFGIAQHMNANEISHLFQLSITA
jgi:hypothetical protein